MSDIQRSPTWCQMPVGKVSQSYLFLALSSRLQMSSRHCLSMSQGSLRPWSTLYLALCFTVSSLWMQLMAVGEIDPQTLSGNMNLASRIWSGIEQFCFVINNFFFFQYSCSKCRSEGSYDCKKKMQKSIPHWKEIVPIETRRWWPRYSTCPGTCCSPCSSTPPGPGRPGSPR